MSRVGKRRILQVVSRMDRAGIETWLMHVLRGLDRERYQMDFLVHGEEPADYDNEILSLGSRILRCGPIQNLWSYGHSIRQLLKTSSPYDVLHVHRDYFSGFPLRAGKQAGIPVRIAHSHNDLRKSFSRLRWPVKVVAAASRALVPRYATHGLAASEVAAETLYGANWRSDSRWQILPCGVDISKSLPATRDDRLRQEFGIPDGAFVVGHVGRFSEQKNHQKILDVAEALARQQANFHVLLVGQGPLQTAVEGEIIRRGLSQQVSIAGPRNDVPHLFASLFDVLLFPSLFEGLGLVIVESLAAGCPAVISDVVPHEADIVKSLVKRIPLASSAEVWARAVIEAATTPRSHTERMAAHRQVSESSYNVSTSIERLTGLYDRAVGEHAGPASTPIAA